MTDYTPDDDDQRIAALMMAAAGLMPADIARHLKVREEQVRQWLGQAWNGERRQHD